MKYPYRLYTFLKAYRFVQKLGVQHGLRTLRTFIRRSQSTSSENFSAETQKLLSVPVPGSQHRVMVRAGSSDQRSYEQVFISEEYAYSSRYSSEKPPRLIIDAGANVGYAAVYYALRFPSATIVSIEPEASNFALLQQNTQVFDHVIPIQGALWSHETALSVKDLSVDKWSFEVQEAHKAAEAQTTQNTVVGYTLRQLMEIAGIYAVDIFKIDIEGAEVEVLASAEAWIEAVHEMMIELHPHKRPEVNQVFEQAIAGRVLERRRCGENYYVRFSEH